LQCYNNNKCRCDECRAAKKVDNKARRDLEAAREYAKSYRETNRDRVLEATRRWRSSNADKISEYQTQYNKRNRDKIRTYQRGYRQENPHFHRAANQRRRARLMGAFVEDVDHQVVFERDNWTCRLCGKLCDNTVKFPHVDAPTLDHIVPLANGGEHSYANAQTLCMSCNCAKGNREIERLANHG
jgi:5-methylcytosine-specific restriction endonuclease McrA